MTPTVFAATHIFHKAWLKLLKGTMYAMATTYNTAQWNSFS